MIQRPDPTDVLAGLARFLESDVRPAIGDAALSYRVLVASMLAKVIAFELHTEDFRLDAQLVRLRALVPSAFGPAASSGSRSESPGLARSRKEQVEDATRVLCAALTAGTLDERHRALADEHVRATLRETLKVSNPFFDLSLDLP